MATETPQHHDRLPSELAADMGLLVDDNQPPAGQPLPAHRFIGVRDGRCIHCAERRGAVIHNAVDDLRQPSNLVRRQMVVGDRLFVWTISASIIRFNVYDVDGDGQHQVAVEAFGTQEAAARWLTDQAFKAVVRAVDDPATDHALLAWIGYLVEWTTT